MFNIAQKYLRVSEQIKTEGRKAKIRRSYAKQGFLFSSLLSIEAVVEVVALFQFSCFCWTQEYLY